MKKFKIKNIWSYIVVFAMFSCDSYVDVVPDNIATIDIAFNSRNNAETFLATLYGYLPAFTAREGNPGFFAGDEMWSNETASQGWEGLNIARGFQIVTDPFLDNWSSNDMFVALRDCNIFLENIDRPRDIEEFERQRWIAEAKVLKAYYHFWLMRMYGPIPTIKENTEVFTSVEGVRAERDKVDDTVEYIVSVIDEALPNLPPLIQNVGEELGRLTQPAAAAIKAKILVYAASPMFNGNTDYIAYVNNDGEAYFNQTYDVSKWEAAAIACKEAIDYAEVGGHVLHETTAQFAISDTTRVKLSLREAVTEPWNQELIWGYSNGSTNAIQSGAYTRTNDEITAENIEKVTSNWAPTFRMAELFYSNNGVPIEEDVNYDYAGRFDLQIGDADHRYFISQGYETVGLHFNRETRFYSSLAFDGATIFGKGRFDDDVPWVVQAKAGEVSAAINQTQFSVTGYWPKKLTNVLDQLVTNFTSERYPWPIIRLGDLYLMYAEALNEANGPTAEAYDFIDRVRDRANLEGVQASWSTYSNDPSKPNSQEGLREIIHQERLIELAFEGHRFWDLRRWKKAQAYMNQPIQGWEIDQRLAEDYYQLRTIWNPIFNLKDYFWPIPEGDIIANPNLDQSPRW